MKTRLFLTGIFFAISINFSFSQNKEIEKVFVEGGTFTMGVSKKEGIRYAFPEHKVTIKDFYISKYEITNSQYVYFLNNTKNINLKEWIRINHCEIEKEGKTFRTKKGKENLPITSVTWYGAKAYAEWVGGRLPTEKEWEYAAKGGNKSKGYKYSGSNNLDSVAWYNKNSKIKDVCYNRIQGSQVVGMKKPNELGIYDMSGNALEWCQNWLFYYNTTRNPNGQYGAKNKTLRGGSWNSHERGCQTNVRYYYLPNRTTYSGIRVVFDKK